MMNLPFTLKKEEYDLINVRLNEFYVLNKANNKAWFSELCFCILTANSQAQRAIDIQKSISEEGFLNLSEEEIRKIIIAHKHRFHNLKAKYIFEARKFKDIKDILSGLSTKEAREFIVKNVKGIGYKEASHFLRNVGYKDCAIIDRHIIKFLVQYKLIDNTPKVITPKIYIQLEKILRNFDIEQNKLDLIIWCHITGKVLK